MAVCYLPDNLPLWQIGSSCTAQLRLVRLGNFRKHFKFLHQFYLHILEIMPAVNYVNKRNKLHNNLHILAKV